MIKHHHTEGAITLKIGGELDRLLDKDIYSIAEKYRWMLDLDLLDKEVLSMWKMQYTAFVLKAAKAQDKVVLN